MIRDARRDDRPEGRPVSEDAQVREFVDDDGLERSGGARMRRHENDSRRDRLALPQRVRGSRSGHGSGVTPSADAWRAISAAIAARPGRAASARGRPPAGRRSFVASTRTSSSDSSPPTRSTPGPPLAPSARSTRTRWSSPRNRIGRRVRRPTRARPVPTACAGRPGDGAATFRARAGTRRRRGSCRETGSSRPRRGRGRSSPAAVAPGAIGAGVVERARPPAGPAAASRALPTPSSARPARWIVGAVAT